MEELIKRVSRTDNLDAICTEESRYQVKFDDQTGNCTLIDKKTRYPKQFASVSQMVNYLREKRIEVTIGDCIVSNIRKTTQHQQLREA